jgi:ubiquinone biosynthesis accessory factor UbiJ
VTKKPCTHLQGFFVSFFACQLQSLGNMITMQSNPFFAIVGTAQALFQARCAQLTCVAINHLLTQEPSVQAHLAAHVGRKVLLRWEAMLAVPAGEQGFVVQNDLTLAPCADDIANNNVTISLQTGLLTAVSPERLRFIRIEGDALFAQDLSLVAKQLRWDAEHDLAQVIGGAPANWVTSKAQQAVSVFRQSVEQFKSRASTAVIHYPGWAVAAADMKSHQIELVALKSRINSLTTRLAGVKR